MEHIRVTKFFKEIKLEGVRSRLEAQKKKKEKKKRKEKKRQEKKKMFLKTIIHKISETN